MKLKIMFGLTLVSLIGCYRIEAREDKIEAQKTDNRASLECKFLRTVFNCRAQTLKLASIILERAQNAEIRLLAQMLIDTYNQAQNLLPALIKLHRELGCCNPR